MWLTRYFEDSEGWTRGTSTIKKFKTSFLSPCLVGWIWRWQHRGCCLCQSARAGVTHASLHSSACPPLKQNCQPSRLAGATTSNGGSTGSVLEIPSIPSETNRQGKWAADHKMPLGKAKARGVNLKYQTQFLKWLQTQFEALSLEAGYVELP